MKYWYNENIAKRYKRQNRIRKIGQFAIYTIFFFILSLVGIISYKAMPAFKKTYIAVDVYLSKDISSRKLILNYMYDKFDVKNRKDKKEIKGMFSDYASIELDKYKRNNLGFKNNKARVWVSASDNLDQYIKGNITLEVPENKRKFSNQQMAWVKKLQLTEQIETRFNKDFFFNADSRDPTHAGILGALIGTLITITICMIFSLIIGILGAIYLEEFSPKNKFSYLLEVTINNLAAIPSIIFGLLGLSVLLNTFGMPRSASITGGIVLAIMSLPTIIIVTRNALRSVPDSLRFAGLGLGATKLQVIIHHVLPKAMPSIMTGAIIAMAQALGETAPLLMIGMIAFVVDIPSTVTDPAVTLPVQIFLWADAPETAFIEKTSAGILILLIIVFVMIFTASYIRHKIEKK